MQWHGFYLFGKHETPTPRATFLVPSFVLPYLHVEPPLTAGSKRLPGRSPKKAQITPLCIIMVLSPTKATRKGSTLSPGLAPPPALLAAVSDAAIAATSWSIRGCTMAFLEQRVHMQGRDNKST